MFSGAWMHAFVRQSLPHGQQHQPKGTETQEHTNEHPPRHTRVPPTWCLKRSFEWPPTVGSRRNCPPPYLRAKVPGIGSRASTQEGKSGDFRHQTLHRARKRRVWRSRAWCAWEWGSASAIIRRDLFFGGSHTEVTPSERGAINQPKPSTSLTILRSNAIVPMSREHVTPCRSHPGSLGSTCA